jgi:hypothetical protein
MNLVASKPITEVPIAVKTSTEQSKNFVLYSFECHHAARKLLLFMMIFIMRKERFFVACEATKKFKVIDGEAL